MTSFAFEHATPTDDGGEIILEVEAQYHPGCRASGPYGERPTDPPESPSIEILNHEDFNLTPDQLVDLFDAAWDHIPDPDDHD
jgi:hypothetical protein